MNRVSLEIIQQAQAFLSLEQKNFINDSVILLNKLKDLDHISDYSFMVSPAAKAYEGYLKDFFLKINIIDKYSYESDRFRVGKTLNPSLRYKRFSIYQKLSDYDEKGEELAEILWNAWKYGRNEIFHYFPGITKNLDHSEAEDRIYLILSAIIKSGQFTKAHIDEFDTLL